MPIKAKAVEKGKAAAFDRGQFSAPAQVDVAKRSYYYEGERRYAAASAARSDSASSSGSSSRSASPLAGRPPRGTGAASHRAPSQGSRGPGDADEDMSDDEEVIRRARAATLALLGRPTPARASDARHRSHDSGGGGGTAASPSSTRLEAYLRGRASSAPSIDAAALTSAEPTQRAPAHKGWVGHDECSTTALSGGDATAATAVALPPVTAAALQWQTDDTQFHELMGLLAEDVRREQRVGAPRPPATAGAPADDYRPPSAASWLAAAGPTAARTYAPPPRTFAAMKDSALEQLYEDWCLQRGEDGNDGEDEEDGEDGVGHASSIGGGAPDVFIAADHRGAAFAIAAAAAQQSALSSSAQHTSAGSSRGAAPTSAHPVTDAPFMWDELLRGEVARRNARHAAAHSSADGAMLSDPVALAEQVSGRLRRFLQSVACVERLVRDRRFMRTVAVFLHEHHKVFLPHYRDAATPSHTAALLRASDDAGGPVETAAASSAVEHAHAEHAVYEEFGGRVSAALLSVLTHHVPDFDEAEFVEALYDTPAADGTIAEDAVDAAAAEDDAGFGGPHSVLSFPAWRLVLAMSGFESFFVWMMDYIYEEYHLDRGGGGGDGGAPAIAVAGSRGLRALILSTYHRPVAAVAAPLDAKPPDAEASRVSDSRTVSLPPRPASEPQRPSSLPAPPSPLPPRLSHTPPPPETAGLPLRGAPLARASGAGEQLRKLFPTPPVTAEGSGRRPSGADGPSYRKRQTTHPGRDLPPITPNTNSLVLSTSGDVAAAATVGELSSSASESAPPPPPGRPRGSRGSQPPPPPTTTTTTASPATRATPLASRGGGAAVPRSTSRSSSTTARSTAGAALKPKPQKPRLNR